ncbi:MAG: M48 family metallopeptidase, partial [Planctomycetota bacterium]|nr:M48 family metallopeptidase [Planctomycetota bacterium]
MTSEQFDKLVNRVQARYGTRPLALRFRIAILVAVGYAGFVALLMVVLLIAVGLILGAFLGGKEPSIYLLAMVSVLLPFAFAQLAAFLWVPIESEKLRELTRGEVPALFDLLDSLRNQLGAKPFDHVRIDPDLNASVQVIPRLGVFGWNRSYLTLGLPLMRVVSPEQFSAVLAHEFGHSLSGHDRFGTWIYRLRQTWSRVFAELHNPSSSSLVSGMRRTILWFVDWFWPRFNAYAFVLSRANEYEADRKAAEWAGVETTAAALFRIECFSNRMKDKFWEEIRQRAKTEPQVANDYVDFRERFFRTLPTV